MRRREVGKGSEQSSAGGESTELALVEGLSTKALYVTLVLASVNRAIVDKGPNVLSLLGVEILSLSCADK